MSVRRLLAALGAMVLLAGCGGDPKPKVESTPTSPTTSPTQPESVKPTSAEEFVREWVELSNEMQVSGETSEYRSVSKPCRACRDTASRVEDLYSSGGHIETRGWKIKRTEFHGSGDERRVDLWVISAPTEVYSGDGEKQRLGGGPNHYQLDIVRAGGTWAATSLVEYSQ